MDKKPKPQTLKPPKENRALERDYSKRLIKLTSTIINSFYYWTMATINKNMNKSISTQLAFNFNELLREWNKKTKDIAKVEAKRVTRQSSNFVNLGLKNQGVDLSIKRNPKELDNELTAIYQRNYNLIKTIPQDIKNRFESAFLNDVNNFDQEAIKKQVLTIKGISERRADTIARDQVAKALDGYATARSQTLGYEYYIFITSKDERTSTGKGGHKQLDGRIYKYDTPTAIIDTYGNVGHPSQRVNCRCRRRPLLLKEGQELELVKDNYSGDYYRIKN